MAAFIGFFGGRPQAVAQGRRMAEVLDDAGGDMRRPEVRQRVVEELARDERTRREAAEEVARQRGLPIRGKYPDGGGFELAGFDGDTPLYRTTYNDSAAISTGANLLRLAPYLVTGGNGTVGVWDEGAVRTTHQEFGGRVTVKDGATTLSDHSTHVAGTIGASGVSPSAKGMAPAAMIDSYDWNSDISEMTGRGAAYPGELGMIYLSNHSYGFNSGWVYTATPTYTWYGSGTTASGYEDDFGKYRAETREVDILAYNLPYYLMFWAAGNDRNNNPANGSSVALSPGGTSVTYDSSSHPPGDGVYKGGYDTVSFNALAKNVVTVGAVGDAVSGGLRSLSGAAMQAFSSWGPTDDGRIKPDLVANGASLYSTVYGGDASYGSKSGTSMATPNAIGTAHLLTEYLGTLFTNTAMRASTLKALLIHTADDLGNAGPDYCFGWGLVNAKAAADLLAAYRANAGTQRVIEDRVTTSRKTVSFPFTWDGTGPIRATLCWTDPAGASTTSHDLRTARLVNNLDLRVIGPGGTEYRPWVMPFVDDWSVAACGYAATTGSNKTDNVEQVLIATPGTAGTYTARVSYAGTLTNGNQPFSLIISGAAAGGTVEAPTLGTSSPLSGSGTLTFTVAGERMAFGTDVRLRRTGQPDVVGVSVEAQGDLLRARFNTSGLAEGWWRLLLTNPDGQRTVLYNAFVVPQIFYSEDFETDNIAGRGWTFVADIGTSQWALSTTKSVSPTRSMFSAGPSSRSDTSVVSATIAVPANGSGFRLSFSHDYVFTTGDGGVLEFSLDGGDWYDAVGSGSGASFTANGYNAIIGGGGGAPNTRNPIANRSGWSGNSGGFKQVVVSLSDTAKYAGKGLRVRWRLGTNSSTASTGWYIDDVVFSGAGDPPDMTKPTVFSVR